MVNKKKNLRAKGKLKFSRAFQTLNKDDFVAVDIERSVAFSFPEKLQGLTGTIKKRRGHSYEVLIKDIAMPKTFIINPIHLKKIIGSKK
ncbi:hypothetical protein J4474_00520 [Candidatus Pacearchaeota archaeon]|nr:hypothetical protein [Candidatus Pacearchaeota archaeon]